MKLTIGEVNHYLDRLAGDEGNESKVKVLTQLLQVTTPNQMKWIIQILLQDLKVRSPEGCGQCSLLAPCTPILHCSELLCCACLQTLEAISHAWTDFLPYHQPLKTSAIDHVCKRAQ